MDKIKSTNNNLQNITHKTKDRATEIPLKSADELHIYSYEQRSMLVRLWTRYQDWFLYLTRFNESETNYIHSKL